MSSPSILIKKADAEYIALVPQRGILIRASSADEVYAKAESEIQKIEKAFQSAGFAEYLHSSEREFLIIKTWSKKLRRWIFFSLFLYFVGLVALAITLGRSLERVGNELGNKLKLPHLEVSRREEDLEKFKKTLEFYRPYFLEVRKTLESEKKD